MSEAHLTVFVSATSRDLARSREVVGRVLRTAGIWAKIQEEFPPDFHQLKQYLRDAVAPCDAVVCLVGPVYGAAPSGGDGLPRSYTQLEYDVAHEFGKPVFVFLTTDQFIPDQASIDGPAEQDLQRRHRQALQDAHKCEWFSTVDELQLKVTRLVPRVLELSDRLSMFYLHPPTPPSYFVGRTEELGQLSEALRRKTPCLVAVTGMGGQGKTTLVYQWLAQQKGFPFAAGFWCTAYRGGFSFEMFLDEILNYLLRGKFDKRELPEVTARASCLLGLLQKSPTLVVVDGLERWLRGWNTLSENLQTAETAEQRQGFYEGLDDFLKQASGLANGTHLILTTRALPAVLDDAALTMVPVYAEEGQDISLKGLDPLASASLLERLGVKGAPQELKMVAAQYGHHPLALTVLGGLLGKKHGGRLDRLPKVTALDPKRALHELFDEARKNLPGRAQAESFLKAAAHALENPSLEVVAAALAHAHGAETLGIDALREQAVTLADWNLVGWDGEREVVSLHMLVKHYFADLVEPADSAALHRRLGAWYARQPLPADAATLEQVRTRILAIEHIRRAGDANAAKEMLFAPVTANYSLIEWLTAWGHQTKGIEMLTLLGESITGSARATILTTRAALHRQLGDLEAATTNLNEAIALLSDDQLPSSAERLADLAGALMNRGNVRRQQGLPEAIADFDQALATLARIKDFGFYLRRSLLIADVRMNRGNTLRDVGRYSEALADCSAAVDLYRNLGKGGLQDLEPVLALGLTNRANTLADLRQHEAALGDFDEAIVLTDRLRAQGRPELEPKLASLRVNRASTLNDAGRGTEAIAALDQAIGTLRHLVAGGRQELESWLALAWMDRGLARARLQHWKEANEDYRSALECYERNVKGGRTFLRGWLAHVLVCSSEARLALGDAEGAALERSRGLELMKRLIDEGQTGVRAIYLRKSLTTARQLLPKNPAQAIAILEPALLEAERGISGHQGEEAIRIEAQRGLSELAGQEALLAKAPNGANLFSRLQACAG